MLENFKKDKIIIENSIDELLTIVSTDTNLHEELITLKNKTEKEIFKLAVLGQFKRGKTTLINALIGENLLPVGVLPLTSVITVLKYGKLLNVKVIFSNKREKAINIKELHLYATEKGNPKNQKKVSVIEVAYSSEYLKRGVEFVDTPGIGSTLLHNTEVTYNYLRNIDAGIFLLSSDLPISQAEIEFLSHVRHNIGKIFFVLNSYEHKSDIDINEIKKFDEKNIADELKENIEIHILNAKLALDGKLEKNKQKLSKSQIPEFEILLNRLFMKEKGNLLLSSLKNNLLRLIEESIYYFELKLKALKMPIEEMESKLKEFHKSVEFIKEEAEKAEPILKSEINKIMEMLDEDLEKFNAKITTILLHKLEKKFNELSNLSKNELISQFQSYYLKLIEETFEPFYKKEEAKVRKQFESASLKFSDIANKTIENIKNLSSKIFNVKLPYITVKDVFVIQSTLYYRIEDAFSLPTEQIKLLLPKFAFRKVYWKNVKDNLSEHLGMNAGRIRSDFLHRLNESSMQFLEVLDKKVDSLVINTESVIKIGLKERKKKSKEVEMFVKDIKNKLKLINDIKNIFKNTF